MASIKTINTAVRVLHVLGSLNRGGAETWLVQLLEQLDRQRVQVDVLVHQSGGTYEEQVRAWGANVLTCEHPHSPFAEMSTLRRLYREFGPYQVVHSHLQLYSGLVLRAAHHAAVPGRIAHARNSKDGRGTSPWRLAYRALMRRWIERHATHLFAVSAVAAEGTFGKKLVANGQCRILTGIDFSPFEAKVDRDQVRRELGIPSDSLVVGHVGSFRRQKNHHFLVDVARHLVELEDNACFLLIGEGELRPGVEEAVSSRGLASAVRFLGEQNDVPRILQAIDVFVFPSLYEGLPRALIEAQAAGVPCIASDRISPEAAAGSQSVQFLSLEEGPAAWAQVLANVAREPNRSLSGAQAIRHFAARGLGIALNARELTELYESIAHSHR